MRTQTPRASSIVTMPLAYSPTASIAATALKRRAVFDTGATFSARVRGAGITCNANNFDTCYVNVRIMEMSVTIGISFTAKITQA